MKQYLSAIAMLLVLLMTMSAFVGCNDKGNIEDDREDKDTQTQTTEEPKTEEELSSEELEQLKQDMAQSILDALAKTEETTQPPQPPTQQPPTSAETEKEEITTSYSDIVNGMLGSLGGLGNGDYDYSRIIAEVLDIYIGSNGTSDFLKTLIKRWVDSKLGRDEQTSATVEEQTTQDQLPDGSEESLREYIAKKTAEAVADEVVNRINEVIDGSVYDAIYNSVYKAMMGNEGFMDGILEENIPGYKELGDLLGGYMQ